MTKIPILLLDRLGFDSHYYRGENGASLFPADSFDVRLITSTRKTHLAVGDALQSVVALPRFDEPALSQAASFSNGLGGIAAKALVALNERLLVPAARLRGDLGIAGDKIGDVLPFRDKLAMKDLVRRGDVRVPRYTSYSVKAARELLDEFGRIVAKPRADAGSRDVSVIGDLADLAAFELRYQGRLTDFEVEEYIDGELYHVDSVVRDSKVVVATAGHSLDPTTSYLDLRTFRDIEVPPGEVFDQLLRFNERVISCFPTFSGVTHHEFFLTGQGPVLCEIAKRWGGGGIRAGFRARTGIDLVEAMLNAQIGRDLPNPTRWNSKISGFAIIYTAPQVMRRRPDLAQPWILDLYLRLEPGQCAPQPHSLDQAVGVVTVTGSNEHEIATRLGLAEQEILACFD